MQNKIQKHSYNSNLAHYFIGENNPFQFLKQNNLDMQNNNHEEYKKFIFDFFNTIKNDYINNNNCSNYRFEFEIETNISDIQALISIETDLKNWIKKNYLTCLVT